MRLIEAPCPVVAAPEVTRYDFTSNRRAMPGVRLMDWARILAFVTGSVDQELLARAEYLAAENRILKAQCSDAEARGFQLPTRPARRPAGMLDRGGSPAHGTAPWRNGRRVREYS